VIVDCALYEQGCRRPGRLPLELAGKAAADDGAFVWIGLYEPTPEEFDAVTREFDLHPLAVEDAINAHQRPKLETYDDSLFLVLKTARYVDPKEMVALGDIMVFVGREFIVTVRHGEASELTTVRHRVECHPELLACGPGAVLHAIVDHVVDDYFPVIEGIEVDIEEVEKEVFSHARTNPAERIYRLKREVLEFYQAAAPLSEPLQRLARGHYELIHEDVQEYFRDAYDHLVKTVAEINNFRDLLTSVLEANLTQVNVRQNDDMRKISAWVAIAVVPTAIAGIYGMNFENMPELKWSFGYPLALGVILLICLTLYRFFRKSGWL
jgi:magnesium transporter